MLRGGVGQRLRVSRAAKGAMILSARAGAIVTVVVYWDGRGSADAQEPLVVPLAIFWTVVVVTLIWMIDGFVRALRSHFNQRSWPHPHRKARSPHRPPGNARAGEVTGNSSNSRDHRGVVRLRRATTRLQRISTLSARLRSPGREMVRARSRFAVTLKKRFVPERLSPVVKRTLAPWELSVPRHLRSRLGYVQRREPVTSDVAVATRADPAADLLVEVCALVYIHGDVS
jgi:hypothetical protein